MEWQNVNRHIDELERMVSSAFSPLSGRRICESYGLHGHMVYDWRPAWQKAREIQQAFKSGIQYPTRADRENAWIRFNSLRNELSQRANADRDVVFSVSQSWRDKIVDEMRDARYTWTFLEVIDPTTVDEAKALGRRLKEARSILHNNRHQMLKEHKDECYAVAEEIKQSHDRFWECYQNEREIRKRSHLQSMRERLQRTDENIRKNEDKLERAVCALKRVEANIEKLQEMLDGARGDEYRDRVGTWLLEAAEKHDSILESIQRLNEWIAQDRDRRDDLALKISARE
jgi:cell division septum initiation protein DivIVA